MSTGDSRGGFLSKVARFVRHPTVDWTELDAHEAAVAQEREALKAAIQRKRRNDQVRHRELNALRALMREQRAHPVAAPADDRASVPPPSGLGVDKNRTIEQIARIEEQMSAHWLQRRTEGEDGEGLRIGGGSTIPARLDGGVTVPAHLQARPGDEPPFAMTIDVVTEDPNAGQAEWQALLSHPGIAEAAVRFANGQFGASQQALRTLMVQEAQSPTAKAAAGVLLDVLHAQGDVPGFEELAAEYAERFGGAVPRWPTPLPAPPPAGAEAAAPAPPMHAWTCPLLLDAAAVAELHRLVAQPGGHKWLDWTDLVSADLAAAQALLGVVEGWLQRPLAFHFRGGAVLRRRLKASTPSGRRENDPVWWLLRLALLRLMARRDEFDLAALDYCVTYGVLPPEWAEPVCRFEVTESVPAAPDPVAAEAVGEPIHPLDTQLAGLDVLEWPAMATTLPGAPTVLPPWAPVATEPLRPGTAVAVQGVLQGDIPDTVQALDAALQHHPVDQPFRIDCHGLQRVDFAAAGSFLQWFMTHTARGLTVELVGVSRLVAAFFHVVGVDETVAVRLRQY